jgi:hypothetical protein
LEILGSIHWVAIWEEGTNYRFQSIDGHVVGLAPSMLGCVREARRQLTQNRTTKLAIPRAQASR